MTYTLHHPRIPHVFVEVSTDREREAHKAAGWRVSPLGGEADPRPAGNASRDEWEAYAISVGADADGVADLSRDELRDSYSD